MEHAAVMSILIVGSIIGMSIIILFAVAIISRYITKKKKTTMRQ